MNVDIEPKADIDLYSRLLAAYEPFDADEAGHLETHLRCWRVRAVGSEVPVRHLTASAFVFHPVEARILAHWHAKLGRWLQPGGHLEPGESPIAACVREVAEETGLAIAEPAEIFDLDVHRVPETPKMAAHDHVDVRFRFRVAEAGLPPSPEGSELRWLTLEELVAGDPTDSGLRRVAAKARRG